MSAARPRQVAQDAISTRHPLSQSMGENRARRRGDATRTLRTAQKLKSYNRSLLSYTCGVHYPKEIPMPRKQTLEKVVTIRIHDEVLSRLERLSEELAQEPIFAPRGNLTQTDLLRLCITYGGAMLERETFLRRMARHSRELHTGEAPEQLPEDGKGFVVDVRTGQTKRPGDPDPGAWEPLEKVSPKRWVAALRDALSPIELLRWTRAQHFDEIEEEARMSG